MHCTVEATERHEVSRGLSAKAELLGTMVLKVTVSVLVLSLGPITGCLQQFYKLHEINTFICTEMAGTEIQNKTSVYSVRRGPAVWTAVNHTVPAAGRRRKTHNVAPAALISSPAHLLARCIVGEVTDGSPLPKNVGNDALKRCF